VHWVLECTAFFVAFRYYLFLRKKTADQITTSNRLSIILGAVVGAFFGSRLIGFLENPLAHLSVSNLLDLLNAKSIMGGLFGGLIGVELSKKIIGEKQSSGDLFTFPIIIGIFIGRIGCFLSGTNEFTYGKATSFFTGMNLGDGISRHPVALYELFYLLLLFFFLYRRKNIFQFENGLLFKVFMILYFGFRFFIEFLKPDVFYVEGLSSIQWLCIICWLYYFRTFKTLFTLAYARLHLL